MKNLRGMLGVRNINRMRNETIGNIFSVRKSVNEFVSENVVR